MPTAPDTADTGHQPTSRSSSSLPPAFPHGSPRGTRNRRLAPASIFAVPASMLSSMTAVSEVDAAGDGASPARASAVRTPEIPVDSNKLAPCAAPTCHTCGNLEFADFTEQRAHVKTDFHRYNVKRKLVKGMPPVSEDEYEDLLADLSSISGSEDESDVDNTACGDVERLIANIADGSSAAEENNLKNRTRRLANSPRVWLRYTASEGRPFQLGVYRNILHYMNSDDGPSDEVDALKRRLLHLNRVDCNGPEEDADPLTWALFMVGGGHFAGALYNCAKGQPFLHKTFHRYTTRRKQGGGQSANDAAKGAAKSAGADLRRYNELALRKDIKQLLESWSVPLQKCELIFVHAPSGNRRVIFGDGEEPSKVLRPGDPRLRNFPFTTKRPTINELNRAFNELTTVKTMEASIETVDNVASFTDAMIPDSDDRRLSAGPDLVVSKPTETKEGQALERLVELAAKGRTVAVVNHLEKHGISLDATLPSRGMPGNYRDATLLHLASSEGHSELVTRLLELGADPTSLARGSVTQDADGTPIGGKTAYEVARNKEVRNAFRRFMASHPDLWDWILRARVPSALTPEMEEQQERKAKERRKKEKERKEKAKREKEETLKAATPILTEATSMTPLAPSARQQQQQQSFPTLPRASQQAVGLSPEARARLERERRAQAAEARMRAAASRGLSSSSSSSAPVVGSNAACAECSRSLAEITPFERLRYRYCSTECVRKHREKLDSKS